MTIQTAFSPSHATSPTSPELLREILAALPDVTRSAEPRIVFASLVDLCTAHFSDTCAIEFIEDDQRATAAPTQPGATEPMAGSGDGISPDLATPFERRPDDVGPYYRGVIRHAWHTRPVTAAAAVIAELLVNHATGIIAHERLAATAKQAEDATTHLQVALTTNRQIGCAMGILMAAHKITSDAAFALLRTASQNSHRKLRDVADEVVLAGCLLQQS